MSPLKGKKPFEHLVNKSNVRHMYPTVKQNEIRDLFIKRQQEDFCNKHGVEYVPPPVVKDYEPHLALAAEAGARVFVLLGNPVNTGPLLEQGFDRGLFGKGTLVIIAQGDGLFDQVDGKWEAKTCKIGGVTYLQPQTYMNESGRSIGSISRFYRWAPEEILVVFDDVSLPLGDLRFRMNGGHGGHNGCL